MQLIKYPCDAEEDYKMATEEKYVEVYIEGWSSRKYIFIGKVRKDNSPINFLTSR